MKFSEKEIASIIDIAKGAGDIILDYYKGNKSLSISTKDDDSPVTKADLAANNHIVKGLNSLFPNIPIISEENSISDNIEAAKNKNCFIVDPLDGTSSFIKGKDQFTVNIALTNNFNVVFGVIYLPVMDIMYYGGFENGSFKIKDFSAKNAQFQKIKVTSKQSDLIVICTQREPERTDIVNELEGRGISIKELVLASSSYKFCLIAEGKADFYPRRASINAWDIAAGHAIVNGSGGSVSDLSGKEILYKFKDDFRVPFFEVGSIK